jgi:hypothetical protein
MPVIIRCSSDGCGKRVKLDIPGEKREEAEVFYVYGFCEEHDPNSPTKKTESLEKIRAELGRVGYPCS